MQRPTDQIRPPLPPPARLVTLLSDLTQFRPHPAAVSLRFLSEREGGIEREPPWWRGRGTALAAAVAFLRPSAPDEFEQKGVCLIQ